MTGCETSINSFGSKHFVVLQDKICVQPRGTTQIWCDSPYMLQMVKCNKPSRAVLQPDVHFLSRSFFFLFFLTICLPSSGSYFSISLFSVQMSDSPGFSSLFACYSLLFLPDSWTTQPRCVRVCAGAVLYKSQISSWRVSRETLSWINIFVWHILWPSEHARITVYWVIIKSISPVLVWFSYFIYNIYYNQHLGASNVSIFLPQRKRQLWSTWVSCQLHCNSMISRFYIRKKKSIMFMEYAGT